IPKDLFRVLVFPDPKETCWRRRSTRVHSVNFIWQTISGLTQWQRFISAAVKPWSQQLRPDAGRLKKRHFSTRIFPVQNRELSSRARRTIGIYPKGGRLKAFRRGSTRRLRECCG